MNGDGYGDVVVGAPFYDAGQTDEGGAFLYRGGAELPAAHVRLACERGRVRGLAGFRGRGRRAT